LQVFYQGVARGEAMFTSDVDRAGFGKRLKGLIQSKNMSQRAAAEALGMPESQLSRYLIGQVPEPGKLLRLAHWANCSMEWLLTGTGPTQKAPSATEASSVQKSSRRQEWDAADMARLESLWNGLSAEMAGVARSRLPDILLALKTVPGKRWWDTFLEAVAVGLLTDPSNKQTREGLIRARAHSMGLLMTLYVNGLSRNESWEFFRQVGELGADLVEPDIASFLRRYAGCFRKPLITATLERDLIHTLLKSMLTVLKEEGFTLAELDSVCEELFQVGKDSAPPNIFVTDWDKGTSKEIHHYIRGQLQILRKTKFTPRTWNKFADAFADKLTSWFNSPDPETPIVPSTHRKKRK
jgi:transcriptional regulator with XRE-family HTH domain